MKRLAILALFLCLLCPAQSLAADQIGIYIAPKLSWMFSNTDMDMKGYTDEGVSTTTTRNHKDSGLGGALAVGYNFSPKFGINLRTELEYAFYSKAKSTKTHFAPDEDGGQYANLKSELSISTLFVNVYYDFKNSSSFTPYVGAGLGFGFIGLDGKAYDDTESFSFGKSSETNFAWNIGLGVAYDFNERFSLDLGYRYAQLGDATSSIKFVDEDGTSTAKERADNISTHQIMLGVRFNF